MKIQGKVTVILDTSYSDHGEYYLRMKVKYKLPNKWFYSGIQKTLASYSNRNSGDNNLNLFLTNCFETIGNKDFLKKEAEQMLLKKLKQLSNDNETYTQIELLQDKLKGINEEGFIIEVEI